MENSQKVSSKTSDGDIDLGQLFSKTGGAVTNIFSWFGKGLGRIANYLLYVLFYLRRNLIWMVLGFCLGLGFGLFKFSRSGPKYSSTLTIRTNFSSSRALYGTMDFLNALVNSSQYDQLAQLLNISATEAEQINNFEASPVISEVITSDMYRDQFLKYDRASKMDTFWMKTITYNEFKSSLTKFDYPIHDIKVTSTNSAIFSKIQNGVLKQISSNKLLQDLKTSEDEANKETVSILKNSLRSLDTLRDTYNKRIASGAKTGETGSNITLLEGTAVTHTPELELYDKMLELKDELNVTRRQSVIGNQILQIYSPFSTIGQKEAFFKQNLIRDSIFGFFASLIILLIVGLYKLLKKAEKAAF